MTALRDALDAALAGRELDPETMQAAISAVMEGEAEPCQVAGLLCALRVKGETPAEIAAAARAMRTHARPVPGGPRAGVLDTCGTGGDGLGTPNISTMVALVAAAEGVPVAKHGNRSVSSKCGSADLLEALGVDLDPGPERAAASLDEVGLTFLFAPAFHPAMRHAAPVRRALGVRTLFNVLGPLSNPAAVDRQVLGVFDPDLTEPLARTLALLGVQEALVVHGEDGMDELTTRAPTRGHHLRGGEVHAFHCEPLDLGLPRPEDADLEGGDAAVNARIAREVLGGAGTPAVVDLVALNAAAALWVGGAAPDLAQGLAAARASLASGAPLAKLEAWVEFLSA